MSCRRHIKTRSTDSRQARRSLFLRRTSSVCEAKQDSESSEMQSLEELPSGLGIHASCSCSQKFPLRWTRPGVSACASWPLAALRAGTVFRQLSRASSGARHKHHTGQLSDLRRLTAGCDWAGLLSHPENPHAHFLAGFFFSRSV